MVFIKYGFVDHNGAKADILKDSRRLIEAHHDTARFAMTRMALAPCSPFSVSPDLIRESAHLARSYRRGIRLHTHPIR